MRARAVARRQPPQARVSLEVAAPREGAVDDGVLEHDGAHAASRERVGDDVDAGE